MCGLQKTPLKFVISAKQKSNICNWLVLCMQKMQYIHYSVCYDNPISSGYTLVF